MIVASWDGDARRIYLAPGVESFQPVEIYQEYRAERRANESFRVWEPLIVFEGGDAKGGGKFRPRNLRLLTDSRGILTKIVPHDSGPYELLVDGEILTDQPDTDPKIFDITNLTTPVFVEYRPPDTELLIVNGSGGSSVSSLDPAALQQIVDALSAGTMAREFFKNLELKEIESMPNVFAPPDDP